MTDTEQWLLRTTASLLLCHYPRSQDAFKRILMDANEQSQYVAEVANMLRELFPDKPIYLKEIDFCEQECVK